MKKYTFIPVLLLLIAIPTFKCLAQNNHIVIDSPSSGFTTVDLKDTLLNTDQSPTFKKFSIDLDQNKVTDLEFVVTTGISNGHYASDARVVVSDNCTFQTQVAKGYTTLAGKDTVHFTRPGFAKMFNSLDTLFADSCNTAFYTVFAKYDSHGEYPRVLYMNEWISGVHFFGFKKTLNNKVYLGWVKIQVTDYYKMVLKEYAIQSLPVGMDELRPSSASIYPNPTSGELTLKDVHYKKLDIYNALGEIVFSRENTNTTSQPSIDIHNLDPGIYFIKIIEQDKEGYFIRKIIKQ